MSKREEESKFAARIIDRTTVGAHVSIAESKGASGPTDVADRRIQPRFAVSLSVTLLGDHNFYTGLTENLSEGGLFIQTQSTLPIGTSIKVEFSLPTSTAKLLIVGEVRWVRSANAVREEHNNYGSGGSEAFKAGMGIQFKEMTPEALRAITKFISIRKPDFYAE